MNHYDFMSFLMKHDLTAEQYLIIYTVLATKEGKAIYAPFLRLAEQYRKKNNTIKSQALAKDAIDKGFLRLINSSKPIKIDNMEITEKFRDLIFVSKDICFRQALNTYPDDLKVDGKTINSKIYKGGVNELKDMYYNVVTQGGNKSEHDLFIKLVKLEFETNRFASVKFDYFISNWEILKESLLKKHKHKLVTSNNRGSYDKQR